MTDPTAPRSIRVLALTRYSEMAASTRQRFIQYIPALRSGGFDVTVAPLFDDAYVAAIGRGGVGKMALARQYVRRITDALVRMRAYDAAWIQYEAFPYLPGLAERAIRLSGVPYIVDYDDAIFHQYDHGGPLRRAILGKKLAPLLRHARGCAAGNDYIADYVSQYCSHVFKIPTVVDTTLYQPAEVRERPLVVGWIGSPSTWRYVEPLLPQLVPAIAEVGAQFRIVGSGKRGSEGPIRFVDWSEDREVAEVQGFDIGIMPVPDEPWGRGKCGYKLIQYMACGVATIASPVGVNVEIVDEGKTGYLVRSNEEWVARLKKLLADAGLRQQLGAAGRLVAEARYSLASQVKPMLNLFERLR